MSEWTTYRIKDVAKLVGEKTNDLTLPYIALDNIVSWDASFIPSDSSSDGNSNECEAGDVLFGKLRPYLAKGFIPSEKSICSPEFLVLRPFETTHNRFLLYYLLSRSFISYIRNQVAGVKMPRTNWTQISAYQILMPPLSEQQAIADYLDKECGKIGKKIELLERKADAYKRLRRSIINRAVTRGSYSQKRVKDIFSIIGGNGFKEELQGRNTGDYPFVKTSDINSNEVYLSSAVNYVEKSDVEKYKFNIVPKDAVICSKIGAALKLNHRKLAACEVIIDNNLQALFPDKTYVPKFYYYVLIMVDMGMFDNLGAIPCVNNKLLRNHHLPVPPVDEQKEIVAYLDEKCGKIDAIIETIQKEVECLKELKRSLINEVVTGKRAI